MGFFGSCRILVDISAIQIVERHYTIPALHSGTGLVLSRAWIHVTRLRSGSFLENLRTLDQQYWKLGAWWENHLVGQPLEQKSQGRFPRKAISIPKRSGRIPWVKPFVVCYCRLDLAKAVANKWRFPLPLLVLFLHRTKRAERNVRNDSSCRSESSTLR